MMIMDAISAEHKLTIRLQGLDDHLSELNDIRDLAISQQIDVNICDTVNDFGRLIKSSTEDDIILSDNYIDGVDNLVLGSGSKIDTQGGTNTGIILLTKYCDNSNIQPGLKILLSQWKISKDTQRLIDRRKSFYSEKFYALNKNDKNILVTFDKILREHITERRQVFIKKKFDFVCGIVDEWALAPDERNRLFGLSSGDDVMWEAIRSGTTSRDVEARCDLVYRLKSNLALVYGGKDLDQETLWLRTANATLGDQTPLDFLGEGYQHRLAELVMRMEGPY